MKDKKEMRIAAFGGFRDIPPRAGGAGSDKFAVELYPRIVKRGYKLLVYIQMKHVKIKIWNTKEYA